jgi:hypothetical protein
MIAASPTVRGKIQLPGKAVTAIFHRTWISMFLPRCAGSIRCQFGLPVKFRLDTSIEIACGQPLLVAVVSELVGDTG